MNKKADLIDESKNQVHEKLINSKFFVKFKMISDKA